MMRTITYFGLFFLMATCPLAYGQLPNDPCVATPTTLCLNNDRFKVDVDWFTEIGNSQTVQDFTDTGKGRVTPISDVWTGMWFFDPDNLDLLVHVFQGCGLNNNYWVFAAGLTDIEVTLTVTDTQTGEVEEFFNPLGTPFEPIQDTEAFATCPRRAMQKAVKPTKAKMPVKVETAQVETLLESAECVASATTICLHDGRFEVSVDTLGLTSPAQKLADGSAGFPFTNPTFFDLFVSVIDGSSANGQYWVAYSMFEPVAFVLTVIDHMTGETKTYDHGLADPIFVQDQVAFVGDDILTIDGTLSGSWFSPSRDGEGFIIDVAVVNGIPTLVLYYFTYENNTSGRQAWLIGSTRIIGNKASVPVSIVEGAQFGAAFNPDDVNPSDWGQVKITFIDCNNALIESESPFFPSVRYEVLRLTPAPTGVTGVCQPAPAAQTLHQSPKPVSAQNVTSIDGGYSGSWFQLDRNGEGLIFNIAVINGVNTLVVFYFTYENNTSGRQAWMVGSAPITGNSVDVPMTITSGAQFGDPFTPDDVVRTPWGNIKITWVDCNLAHIEVTSESFGDVSFDVNRLTPPTIGTTGDCAM